MLNVYCSMELEHERERFKNIFCYGFVQHTVFVVVSECFTKCKNYASSVIPVSGVIDTYIKNSLIYFKVKNFYLLIIMLYILYI